LGGRPILALWAFVVLALWALGSDMGVRAGVALLKQT